MGMRWKGFRKVRRQVCRRIRRRTGELHLGGLHAYRDHLEAHPREWENLRPLCRVTISRFFRDRGLWRTLGRQVLPELASTLVPGEPFRAWSAGCASGEEPYTLSLLWRVDPHPRFREHPLEVVATDVDETVLERARSGIYSAGSLREVSSRRLEAGFAVEDGSEPGFRLRDAFREGITFLRQDIVEEMPMGPFHLVLCRNLVFTYFDPLVQGRVLEGIVERLAPGAALVLGRHEEMPPRGPPWPLVPWVAAESVHRLP
jgi:chemotaxis protein methyltransferase CheR